jgi:hypothetical protein
VTFRVALATVVVALVAAACFPPAGPAPPVDPQRVVCQGVPQAACRQALDVIVSNPGGAPQGAIARVVVRCTLPLCTDANGETQITVFYVDGRQETSGYGWSSAPAMPVQPVDPGNSG